MLAMSQEERRRRQVDSVVYWSEATLIQIERVRAVNAELAQLSRSPPWDKPGWEAEYMPPWYRLEADRNLLLVAAYHLVRAVAFLQPPSSEDTSGLQAIRSLGATLKTLRDCVEHWDESRIEWMQRPPTPLSGQAYRDLVQLDPAADIQSHHWSASGNDALIAGVLDLRELHDATSAAREYYRRLAEGWYVWNGWPSPGDRP
jgi:hypothetical protein